ncbi:hypothetical protein AQ481_14315 [Acinetobacter baumannii]|nr:hypothetical protein AQ481_14315 [Acinetobacter baumannii]KUI75802.1 hypothetical protein AQ480_16650 [Acinetobacter baumannii]
MWQEVERMMNQTSSLFVFHAIKRKPNRRAGRGGLKVPSPSPLDTAPHLIYKKISLSEKVKAKS